jgi:hypothetical protein
MSVQQNHAAAGAAATAAHTINKKWWEKSAWWIHLALGSTLVLVALMAISTWQFNFFWKLVAGISLIWMGGKIAKVTSPYKIWGKVLTLFGWAIIVTGLLNSGFRVALERGVTQLEQAASGTPAQVVIDLYSNEKVEMEFDLDQKLVIKWPSRSRISDGKRHWLCRSNLSPYKGDIKFESSGNFTERTEIKLDQKTQTTIREEGFSRISMKFWTVYSEKSECS